MKYAVISDIHANPAALTAVLDDAERQNVDRVICLGDVTGFGYDASAAYVLVKENCGEWLLGNHDAACAGAVSEAVVRINPNYDFDFAAYMKHFAERGLPLPVWLERLNASAGELLRKMTKKKRLNI